MTRLYGRSPAQPHFFQKVTAGAERRTLYPLSPGKGNWGERQQELEHDVQTQKQVEHVPKVNLSFKAPFAFGILGSQTALKSQNTGLGDIH